MKLENILEKSFGVSKSYNLQKVSENTLFLINPFVKMEDEDYLP